MIKSHAVLIALPFIAVFLGLLIDFAAMKVISRPSRQSKRSIVGQSLAKNLRRPAALIFPLVGLIAAIPFVPISGYFRAILLHIIDLVVIGVFAWLLVRTAYVLDDIAFAHFELATGDIRSRKVLTQIKVLRKIIIFVIILLAIAAMLTTFSKVRALGASILASAGIVSIVAGLAARPAVSNLFSGIQLAIAQPIRIDDVVVVNNEWGRIEEITLTYVVVKVWDLRRLILPISYFTQNPFENWTHSSAQLVGTIYLYLDYTVPVKPIREALAEIVKTCPDWDGNVWTLQMTNTTAQVIELRALVSASDSTKLWNLRCEVREKLVEFVQDNYPSSLPKIRADLNNAQPKTQDDKNPLLGSNYVTFDE